jgi:hypothetical protein
MGTRNYYLSVRVEKQPAGSKLTVRSGNTLASERYKSLVLGWAGGDQNCARYLTLPATLSGNNWSCHSDYLSLS